MIYWLRKFFGLLSIEEIQSELLCKVNNYYEIVYWIESKNRMPNYFNEVQKIKQAIYSIDKHTSKKSIKAIENALDSCISLEELW